MQSHPLSTRLQDRGILRRPLTNHTVDLLKIRRWENIMMLKVRRRVPTTGRWSGNPPAVEPDVQRYRQIHFFRRFVDWPKRLLPVQHVRGAVHHHTHKLGTSCGSPRRLVQGLAIGRKWRQRIYRPWEPLSIDPLVHCLCEFRRIVRVRECR